MNKYNFIIGGIVALLLIAIGAFSGWNAHEKFRPCPIITTDTIVVEDIHWHHIADSLAGLPPNEIIRWLPQDTLYIPGDSIPIVVDTAAILKDYFSVYKYHWEKKDDTLAIDLYTSVTKNMPIKYDLSYKILTPFTTVVNNVDNSITYNRYLTVGFDIPIYHSPGYKVPIDVMMVSIEANYIWDKGYLGVGYLPEKREFSAKLGTALFKFKNKR